jgi:hypothetical protein
VLIATNAARSAGASKPITRPIRGGSGLPPISSGPAPLIAIVAAPTSTTIHQASFIGAATR